MLDEGEAVQEEELMDTLRDLREKGENGLIIDLVFVLLIFFF